MVIKIVLLLLLFLTIIAIWYGANNIILKEGLQGNGIIKLPLYEGTWDVTDTTGYYKLNLSAYPKIKQSANADDFAKNCINNGPSEISTLLISGKPLHYEAYYTSVQFDDQSTTNITLSDIATHPGKEEGVLCDENLMPNNYDSSKYPALADNPDPYFIYKNGNLHYFPDSKLFSDYKINNISEFSRYNCSSMSIGNDVLPKNPKEGENMMCDFDQMPKDFKDSNYPVIANENKIPLTNFTHLEKYKKYNGKSINRYFKFSNGKLHYFRKMGNLWAYDLNSSKSNSMKLYNCSSLSIGEDVKSPLPNDMENISCFQSAMPKNYDYDEYPTLPGQQYPYFRYFADSLFYYPSTKVQSDYNFNPKKQGSKVNSKQYDCSDLDITANMQPSVPNENEDMVCDNDLKPKGLGSSNYDYYRYSKGELHGYPEGNREILKTNGFKQDVKHTVYNCSSLSVGEPMKAIPYSLITDKLPGDKYATSKKYYAYDFAATSSKNDYLVIRNSNIETCIHKCNQHSECLGFSWDPPENGVNFTRSDCYLKKDLNERKYHNSKSITYVSDSKYKVNDLINPLGKTINNGLKSYTPQKFMNSSGEGVIDVYNQQMFYKKTAEDCAAECDKINGCLGFYLNNTEKASAHGTCIVTTSEDVMNDRSYVTKYGGKLSQQFYRRNYGPFNGLGTIRPRINYNKAITSDTENSYSFNKNTLTSCLNPNAIVEPGFMYITRHCKITINVDLINVNIMLVGGGGAGGGATRYNDDLAGAGGGGGGAVVLLKYDSLKAGREFTINIGEGGESHATPEKPGGGGGGQTLIIDDNKETWASGGGAGGCTGGLSDGNGNIVVPNRGVWNVYGELGGCGGGASGYKAPYTGNKGGSVYSINNNYLAKNVVFFGHKGGLSRSGGGGGGGGGAGGAGNDTRGEDGGDGGAGYIWIDGNAYGPGGGGGASGKVVPSDGERMSQGGWRAFGAQGGKGESSQNEEGTNATNYGGGGGGRMYISGETISNDCCKGMQGIVAISWGCDITAPAPEPDQPKMETS